MFSPYTPTCGILWLLHTLLAKKHTLQLLSLSLAMVNDSETEASLHHPSPPSEEQTAFACGHDVPWTGTHGPNAMLVSIRTCNYR